MRVLLIFLLLLSCGVCFSQEPNFVEGVEAYKAQDFKKSKEIFGELLNAHPNNSVLLYNLGLAEYNLGHSGLALGLWRKARYLNPDFEPIQQAISFAEEQLFPREQSKSFIITVYSWLLQIPLFIWLSVSLTLLFAASWYAIEYGAKQKKAFLEWPSWIYITIPVFIFTSFFSTHLVLDKRVLRATVVAKEISTHSTPSDTSPKLSELQEGQVVYVEKNLGEWVQIRTENGAPGWVQNNHLIAFRR